jgi:hypothetical protein
LRLAVGTVKILAEYKAAVTHHAQQEVAAGAAEQDDTAASSEHYDLEAGLGPEHEEEEPDIKRESVLDSSFDDQFLFYDGTKQEAVSVSSEGPKKRTGRASRKQ